MSEGLPDSETNTVRVDTNNIDRTSSPVPPVSRDERARDAERINAAGERLVAQARELLRKTSEAERRMETLQQQLSEAVERWKGPITEVSH